MPAPRRFSHSKLSAYETCPLQYKFRYVDGIRIPRENIESFLGSLVHETLEGLYAGIREGRVPPEDELLASFRNAWAARWTPEIVIVREGDTPEAYQALGERCLRGYHRRYRPFNQSEVLGTEVRVEAPLDDRGETWMTGVIDRLSRVAPGVYEIRDYKTGRWVPDQAELDRDRQLGLYEVAVRRRYPDAREVQLVWNYLRHDRECRSRRTPDGLRRLREETVALVVRILEAERTLESRVGPGGRPEPEPPEFPARKSRLCDWCEYRAICPAWGGDPAAAPKPPTPPGYLFPVD
ncbi:MAG: PD-(D/E)XK nuclease family protein [Planctomycetales bacterium]|nr:PD-(D/E)XK nuclease family protein [Planctomycetales bacterium]